MDPRDNYHASFDEVFDCIAQDICRDFRMEKDWNYSTEKTEKLQSAVPDEFLIIAVFINNNKPHNPFVIFGYNEKIYGLLFPIHEDIIGLIGYIFPIQWSWAYSFWMYKQRVLERDDNPMLFDAIAEDSNIGLEIEKPTIMNEFIQTCKDNL